MLFFEADAVAVEDPPDRSDPRLLLTLIEQTALDFFQCQVGLLPNQSKQPFLMLLQRRPALALVGLGLKAAALPPALRPADRRRIPNHKLSRSRSCRRAALNNLDHSNPQIVRIPHCRPTQSEKATESYSRLSVNPFDSQKMENALADSEYTYLEGQRLGDYRTVLTVPMLREGIAIGVLSLTRSEVRPFTDKQIELATTFADQAAIAIENVRLFESVESRTRELAKSLEDLRTAQDRLVQTQKLASLGQLTAGIAHEIKNPLNFVNNFSALSQELVDELGDALKPVDLGDKKRAELDELTHMLKGNLEKVVQHGKRADSIVKNMLLHSREGSGERRPVDLNAVVEDSLNLAYHGARAENQEFKIKLERSFDPAAGQVDLFPQEITRVLLNLISNGFYAAM